MPHTLRFPAWAKNPQARPQKARNDGAVNNGPNAAGAAGVAQQRQFVDAAVG
jgi:hypothetical protein